MAAETGVETVERGQCEAHESRDRRFIKWCVCSALRRRRHRRVPQGRRPGIQCVTRVTGDDFEDDVSDDGAEAKASPVDEEPPAKAVDAKASPQVVLTPSQRRGLAPRSSTKDRRRLSTSDLEDVKRRASQPKADGASVDDAITEILMGRKAKHELGGAP